jgi:undecaprenyl-diphosphatase
VEIIQAILLGLVEGLTEFIPVSSTGHLILAGHLLGFVGEKADTFDIFIQLGAILAVVFLYKERFLSLLSFQKGNGFSGMNGMILLSLTTLPALLIGALAHSAIKQYLFSPVTVAWGLGVGGIVMILVERKRSAQGEQNERAGLDQLRIKDALAIGCFQCLAMWPGISRSGATIVGGMLMGMERKTAAEYSFLAAVPVMVAATTLDLYKTFPLLDRSDYLTFLIGFGISFLSAMVAIRVFIRLLGAVTLRPFGWYRMGLALVILGGTYFV